MIVISDNSPLSAFLAINRLDILKSMYEKIIIPKAVYQELENLKLRGVDISPIQNAERIEIQMAIPMPNVLPSGVLDAGETEAIWLAKQLNADWLIIDENKGRKVALQLG
ncbi:MAG: hypothetical protein MUE85_24265, partial [Microscillaceae bacterium]|nr:hypothetical protein [Microscillaceae bacterium]